MDLAEGAPALLTLAHPVDLHATLRPLRRGGADPQHRVVPGGAVWRTSREVSGPATVRLQALSPWQVEVRAWGPGAEEARAAVPALLGQDDDAAGFDPPPGPVRTAWRRTRGLRLTRTGHVTDALVAAVIEQRVMGASAHAAWRRLLTRHGDVPPGPAPDGMRVPPTAATWASVPVWDFHRAGVDPRRARTVVAACRLGRQMAAAARMTPADAVARLTYVPGVGVWTAAEVVQRVQGAADVVSVGDYNVPALVGWAMVGHDLDDDGMLELLEPYRPHRQRAVRHLLASGLARRPRRGPRLEIQDHRAY